jgi:hypothetical protein
MQIDQLDFELIENPHDVNDYILNPEDLDDQKIQTNLQNIGLVARDLFRSSYYNQLIIDEALSHDNFCMKYSLFFSTAQALNTEHQQIIDNLQNQIAGMDFTRSITTPEGENITENYIPAIFAINAETADPTLPPIVSAGVYVNPEYPETQKYDEYIVAWIFDSNTQEWKEILINEEVTLTTTHPIFIMDNAGIEISERPRTLFTEGGNSGKTNSNDDKRLFAMNDYKINYRYERWGDSELAVSCMLIDEFGDDQFTLFNNKGWSLIEEEKATIFKSSIGNMHYNQWREITEIKYQVTDLVPFGQNHFFWNTFERDYAKSPIDLGKGTAIGITVYLSGRASYENEWYSYQPKSGGAIINVPELDMNYTWNAWSKAHINYKSDIRIWRSGGI